MPLRQFSSKIGSGALEIFPHSIMTTSISLDFSYAYGEPAARAKFRTQAADFIVEEMLGFAPCGEGEHLYVHIRKWGENTRWVADKLAAHFGVRSIDVGYSGKKDRQADTSQWFSVHLPGHKDDVDWGDFIRQSELRATVIESAKHRHKLRLGSHQANRFAIRLREIDGLDDATTRLEKIRRNGVPNYFGEQRFGRNGGNLALAARWFEQGEKIANRDQRSMVMSAARAYLFNAVLSERVARQNWATALPGDVLAPDGHASGPLWGRGRLPSRDQALAFETNALEDFAAWRTQLEHVGLKQERRPLVLSPKNLSWCARASDLILEFQLLPGQFATALLREVCKLIR